MFCGGVSKVRIIGIITNILDDHSSITINDEKLNKRRQIKHLKLILELF